jgi:hypothetical protein
MIPVCGLRSATIMDTVISQVCGKQASHSISNSDHGLVLVAGLAAVVYDCGAQYN